MGNSGSQIVDSNTDTFAEEPGLGILSDSPSARTSSQDIEEISSNPRKRRMESPTPDTDYSNQVSIPNPEMVGAGSSLDNEQVEEPPQKKQKTDLPIILKESIAIDPKTTLEEPIAIDNKILDPHPFPALSGQIQSWETPWVEDAATTLDLLSTYVKPLNITSIQLEQLTGKSMNGDWRETFSSPEIVAVINEGVNQILEVLKLGFMEENMEPLPPKEGLWETKTHDRIAVEIDERNPTTEVGVETDLESITVAEPISDLVTSHLQERIAILHEEKEKLQQATLKNSDELDKEKQQFEDKMTASLNAKWNEHVGILNNHKKKIIEDAKLNQKNREWLIRVKTRLMTEIRELVKERKEFEEEENQRRKRELHKQEEERKESEKTQEMLRVKERNEIWMLKKLERQENTLIIFQEEKEKWEKERETIGIEMRRLRAELAQPREKMPMSTEASSQVNDGRALILGH